MEDLVSVRLCHAGVDEEAGVPQLCNLLGQQLHSLHRVAKDDALVDLKLWCVVCVVCVWGGREHTVVSMWRVLLADSVALLQDVVYQHSCSQSMKTVCHVKYFANV